MLYNITPREFEEVVERIFISEGFETQLTKAIRDGGKDIIAVKYNMGKPIVFYVECKQYGRHRTVDVNIVRSLYGVKSINDRYYDEAENRVIIEAPIHMSFGRDGIPKWYFDTATLPVKDISDVSEIGNYIARDCSAEE